MNAMRVRAMAVLGAVLIVAGEADSRFVSIRNGGHLWIGKRRGTSIFVR